MICQILITDAWAGVIAMIAMGLLAWEYRLQAQINKIRTDLAVNSAKDEAINGSIAEMKADISEIKRNITMILGFIEGEKVLRENGKK